MALSQCLDDSPGPRLFSRENDMQIKGLYNERHRLALEELISGGLDSFLGFLKKEKIPNFLSDEEIRGITSSAVVPRCASVEDVGLEHSVSSSMDCSSVTYFPDVSDVEPPVLEMGWPAFTAGSFRGITRAVAHFQPSYGECIYSCKEAARRMIRSAKEVIAIVADSLTDLDIFRDLQEACTRHRVPVYLLLDQSCIPSFLQMCTNLNVRLEELRVCIKTLGGQLMRVRTITGATYFLRSGAKITGKVHERFMLIDGNRVATGSYRFNWTDGKLNSSNLIELSGQITESFDEEFRILYAQSLPLPAHQNANTRAPLGARTGGICDHLLHKLSVAPSSPKVRLLEPVRLSSTPNRAAPHRNESCKERTLGRPVSEVSTIGEDWMEQERMQDVLHADRHGEGAGLPLQLPTCHVSTQTSSTAEDKCVQTEVEAQPPPPVIVAMGTPEAVSRGLPRPESPPHKSMAKNPMPTVHAAAACHTAADSHLRDCFRRLTKERQYHYSTIRSKLDHMVMLLAHRRELGDLTNLALGTNTQRVCKEQGLVSRKVDVSLVPPWPRVQCLQ